MATFSASVQYDDWRGEAAADDADGEQVAAYLERKGLIAPDQFVVGVKAYLMEPSTGARQFICTALVVNAQSFGEASKLISKAGGVLPVQKIDFQAGLEEFLDLFKRFDIVLGRQGLGVVGREVPEDK